MDITAGVLTWLLKPENPSVRYRTLTELLGMSVLTERLALIALSPIAMLGRVGRDGFPNIKAMLNLEEV